MITNASSEDPGPAAEIRSRSEGSTTTAHGGNVLASMARISPVVEKQLEPVAQYRYVPCEASLRIR